MATVKEIYRFLDELAPFFMQEDFDNAGFLVGRGEADVRRILVTLDITQAVVEEAVELGCQLIVAHHPIIFHPAKSMTDETVNGRILLMLAENHLAAICAHTNLDAARGGVNDCLAEKLGLDRVELLEQSGVDAQGHPYGIGRVGCAHQSGLSAGEYAQFVKERLGTSSVRYTDNGKPVSRVAVGGGACASMLELARQLDCDTFVTADVKHDRFLEAVGMGINLMDAGHYATENVVCPYLKEKLVARFPDVQVLQSCRDREVYENA